MLQRRGFVPEISVGAFKKPDDELVGLMLSGLRNWCGKLTAYDLLTGVTPSNRKQGITGHMFKHMLAADFHQSWQNSIESISAVQDEFIYSAVHLDGKLVGYGIVGKQTGDAPQIAVHREYRQKGIAESIVSSLLEATEANETRILNVDNACEEMKLFLNKLGFKWIGNQYEMSLPLISK